MCGLVSQHKPSETINAGHILRLEDCGKFGGMKFPIIKGCSRPFLRPVRISSGIHGESGLDADGDYVFPPIPEHALEYTKRINEQTTPHFTTKMYDYFRSLAPRKVTILATGPLTNIALLLINHPDVVNYIERIVMMGGSVGPANYGPAEFNILVDPEAASFVFNESNVEIYMVPLDVTDTAEAVPWVMDRIEAVGSYFCKLVLSWLKFAKKTTGKRKKRLGPPLHDVCAAAFLINPDLFEHRLMRVDVETNSPLCTGQTICDFYGYSDKRKNVDVALKMDLEKFWEMVIESISKANSISPANQ